MAWYNLHLSWSSQQTRFYDFISDLGLLIGHTVSGLARWLVIMRYFHLNKHWDVHPVFTRKSQHCPSIIKSNLHFNPVKMFPILLSDSIPCIHSCFELCFSSFYVQQSYVYCLLCLSDWEHSLARVGAGWLKEPLAIKTWAVRSYIQRRGRMLAVNGLQRYIHHGQGFPWHGGLATVIQ